MRTHKSLKETLPCASVSMTCDSDARNSLCFICSDLYSTNSELDYFTNCDESSKEQNPIISDVQTSVYRGIEKAKSTESAPQTHCSHPNPSMGEKEDGWTVHSLCTKKCLKEAMQPVVEVGVVDVVGCQHS